ncbi:MAG TPA: lysine-2,3-aminomutase-like protein [Methylocella sp.]|nr:lysine-2,3-aminomutase-like protein [Methylocella sp.]
MANRSSPLHTVADFIKAGLLDEAQREVAEKIAAIYAVGLSAPMAALIDKTDPDDPIARQFVPNPAELNGHQGERADPIGDQRYSPVEGIVHRYPDRALLKLLHVCPVYCRFCFRRAVVGPNGPTHLAPEALSRALLYLADHPEIWEVILTGGDPLTLSTRRLADIFSRLSAIRHVKILRLHTRVPVAEPERITPALTALLRSSGMSVYVVLHANHPRELTLAARAACARLIDAGIPMLSQSVLLRGVNDDIETLTALMRAFVEVRIKPYYLHQLDAAQGTAHFVVPIERGRELMRALRGKVSGLCQPHYMLDIPGGHGKSPIGPNYLEKLADGAFEILDYHGQAHVYPPGTSSEAEGDSPDGPSGGSRE